MDASTCTVPRREHLQRVQCRLARRHAGRIVAVRPNQCDACAAGIVAIRVPCHRIWPTIPALIDVAIPVHQVVIADIAPPERDSVVVIDRTYPLGCLSLRVVVCGHRVVDHDLARRSLCGCPVHMAFIGPPAGASDDRGLWHAVGRPPLHSVRLGLHSRRPHCRVHVDQGNPVQDRPRPLKGHSVLELPPVG